MNGFAERVAAECGGAPLVAGGVETVQVNLGLRCNLACTHCHLKASPTRREEMTWPVMEGVLSLVARARCTQVDLTGGAPELNPHFKPLVRALLERGAAVQVRTNLTVLLTPGQEDTPRFLRDHQVALVASMPCYLEENVRTQRGGQAYEGSVAALRLLNDLGYGREEGLPLNLVYNPGGAFLPPAQEKLEADYKRELFTRFGVVFNRLLTIANMPLGRYQESLNRQGQLTGYQSLLEDAFNAQTLTGLMCRSQVTVGWDGTLYDCDFNHALNLPISTPSHITAADPATLQGRPIVTGRHCFACTAGSGSSCKGALVA